ncbi:MAG: RCC1 domain-containing protein, partial [Verrucomicrobiota bacterium]
TPFLAKWPTGETGWKEISGSWAIANSGKLYQNGVTLIPFPSGVTAWQHVSRGFNGGVTVGDNGDLYYGGTTRIEVTRPPGGWKDARASLTDVNNIILGLGEDHEAYVISSGPYGPGDWSAAMLTRPAGVNGWKSIAQAALFGLLLTDNDDLWIYGEYGGVTGTSDTPGFSHVPLPEGVTRWVDFAAGGFHVLAIGDNGQLYAWGRNWEHQLGIGLDQNPRATPVKVDLPEGVSGWSSVAAGYFHSIAIGLDCSLYAWGENAGGQAGQPPSPPLSRPFRVGSLEALCGTPVLFTDGNTSRLPDGSFRLEFNSDLNRSYLIQYSDDLRTWKNATSAITGTGELVTWIDDGPPKTDAHPATVTTRTYRVVYAP